MCVCVYTHTHIYTHNHTCIHTHTWAPEAKLMKTYIMSHPAHH